MTSGKKEPLPQYKKHQQPTTRLTSLMLHTRIREYSQRCISRCTCDTVQYKELLAILVGASAISKGTDSKDVQVTKISPLERLAV